MAAISSVLCEFRVAINNLVIAHSHNSMEKNAEKESINPGLSALGEGYRSPSLPSRYFPHGFLLQNALKPLIYDAIE